MSGVIEFEGPFVGGPDDGNIYTTSKERIAVFTTSKIWLDGISNDKDITVIETHGYYVWRESHNDFIWVRESADVYKQTKIA